MPRKLFFTYELVQASPSERHDKYTIYRTPFGVVRERDSGSLEIHHQNEWIPLKKAHDQLLLVFGTNNVGLIPKIVYDSHWDHIKSSLKTYWWLLVLLVFVFVTITSLDASPLWMTGIFIVATSFIIYQEREKAGIRQATTCLFWGIITFVALIFFIEIMYALLHALQSLMGLCDGTNCGPPNIWLNPNSEYDPGITGGRGRYGF